MSHPPSSSSAPWAPPKFERMRASKRFYTQWEDLVRERLVGARVEPPSFEEVAVLFDRERVPVPPEKRRHIYESLTHRPNFRKKCVELHHDTLRRAPPGAGGSHNDSGGIEGDADSSDSSVEEWEPPPPNLVTPTAAQPKRLFSSAAPPTDPPSHSPPSIPSSSSSFVPTSSSSSSAASSQEAKQGPVNSVVDLTEGEGAPAPKRQALGAPGRPSILELARAEVTRLRQDVAERRPTCDLARMRTQLARHRLSSAKACEATLEAGATGAVRELVRESVEKAQAEMDALEENMNRGAAELRRLENDEYYAEALVAVMESVRHPNERRSPEPAPAPVPVPAPSTSPSSIPAAATGPASSAASAPAPEEISSYPPFPEPLPSERVRGDFVILQRFVQNGRPTLRVFKYFAGGSTLVVDSEDDTPDNPHYQSVGSVVRIVDDRSLCK